MVISCIYNIRCKISNSYYIGRSMDYRRRCRKHLAALRINKHGNTQLQRRYNKYGPESLEFTIIEEVPQELLETREQFWINKHYDDALCMNESKSSSGGSGPDYLHLRYLDPDGMPHDTYCPCETARELGLIPCEFARAINGTRKSGCQGYRPYSDALVGVKWTKEQSEIERYQAIRKTYHIVDANGKCIIVKHMSEFCITNNLGKSQMREVVAKLKFHYKGYRLATKETIGIKHLFKKKYHFVNPKGEVEQIDDLREFCSNNNLHAGHMCAVSVGTEPSHKGWRQHKSEYIGIAYISGSMRKKNK